MRATLHNGRAGKDGVFSTKHNDRKYDTTKDEHIDVSKSPDNYVWTRFENAKSIDENEHKFYVKYFSKFLEKRNEKCVKNGHADRNQTIDELRLTKRYAPDEMIFQVGNADDTIEPKELRRIFNEFNNWRFSNYPQVRCLDYALHTDEEGAPHIHARYVYTAKDNDGDLEPNQRKCFEQMGVALPKPGKPRGRHNNEKITYTKACRDKFLSICKAHGYNMEIDPREVSKSGKTLLEYQAEKEQEKLDFARAKNASLTAQNDVLTKENKNIDKLVDEKKKDAEKRAQQAYNAKLQELTAKLNNMRNEVSSLETQRDDLTSEVNNLKSEVNNSKIKAQNAYKDEIEVQKRKLNELKKDVGKQENYLKWLVNHAIQNINDVLMNLVCSITIGWTRDDGKNVWTELNTELSNDKDYEALYLQQHEDNGFEFDDL